MGVVVVVVVVVAVVLNLRVKYASRTTFGEVATKCTTALAGIPSKGLEPGGFLLERSFTAFMCLLHVSN